MQTVERLRRSGVGISPDQTIVHAAQVMEQSGLGMLAVIEDGQLVGVVTDRDLVRRVLAAGRVVDGRIDSVMSSPVVTIDADADLVEATALFSRHSVRRLAVVDGTRFIGVLSIDDLLVDAATSLTDLTAPLAAEIDRPHRDPGSLIETGGV